MSWGKMTFGGKCRSQGYYGKKWGKMLFGEKCCREKCCGEKRLWGKLSCTRKEQSSPIKNNPSIARSIHPYQKQSKPFESNPGHIQH